MANNRPTTKMKKFEVRRIEPWCEAGVVVDRLELTPKQEEEVEATLKAHPGMLLVEVQPDVFRRLIGKYTVK